MNDHLQYESDLGLYALGVLEGDDKRSLESHLAECSECAQELEAARGRVAMLGLAAPAQVPPERVKLRLLKQIGTPGKVQPAALRTPFWRWAMPVLALASLVLATSTVVLKTQNDQLNRRLMELQTARQLSDAELARTRAVVELLTAPDTLKVTLVAGETRPVPQGKAFYHPGKGLLFYAANLPALGAGKTYQLWLVPTEGNPISAGIFQTDSKGNGEIVLPELPKGAAAKAFAVTVEPAGGVPQPTGSKVLVGMVS